MSDTATSEMIRLTELLGEMQRERDEAREAIKIWVSQTKPAGTEALNDLVNILVRERDAAKARFESSQTDFKNYVEQAAIEKCDLRRERDEYHRAADRWRCAADRWRIVAMAVSGDRDAWKDCAELQNVALQADSGPSSIGFALAEFTRLSTPTHAEPKTMTKENECPGCGELSLAPIGLEGWKCKNDKCDVHTFHTRTPHAEPSSPVAASEPTKDT